MAERAFIDSNILLYAIGDDAGRREVAEALLVQRPVVSAQVIAELSAVLRRKFGYAPAAVVSVLEAILPRVHCEPVTAQIVLSALAVGERLGYSHYDSQIIAGTLAADCSVLYSEDMQHGQRIDGRLTIVNPFMA